MTAARVEQRLDHLQAPACLYRTEGRIGGRVFLLAMVRGFPPIRKKREWMGHPAPGSEVDLHWSHHDGCVIEQTASRKQQHHKLSSLKKRSVG